MKKLILYFLLVLTLQLSAHPCTKSGPFESLVATVQGKATLSHVDGSPLLLIFSTDFHTTVGDSVRVYSGKDSTWNAQALALNLLVNDTGEQYFFYPIDKEVQDFDYVFLRNEKNGDILAKVKLQPDNGPCVNGLTELEQKEAIKINGKQLTIGSFNGRVETTIQLITIEGKLVAQDSAASFQENLKSNFPYIVLFLRNKTLIFQRKILIQK